MINVTSCVQSVLHLQPHTLEVSFATLQLLYQSCAGQACPIPQQSDVVDPGVKVNGQYYQDILLTRDLLPDIKQYSDYFTFQQDGAPAHRVRETVELLKVETSGFIPPYGHPTAPISTQWTTRSGAYCKNGFTRQAVRMSSYVELRRRIAEEWDKLDQCITDKAVGEWRKRLQACVAAGGGHFEQKM